MVVEVSVAELHDYAGVTLVQLAYVDEADEKGGLERADHIQLARLDVLREHPLDCDLQKTITI